ncbi:phage terminase small subunit P27 family [Streptomyces sp. WMMC897]|uniref:phage terminase small subunit P27 family n=1 Tax=Streptomyces sp. WMMC897 TaxID=3014782 RepID=UPI0022B69597|nr:phage terminase small subunit P27 family [Streptomyces sp. WMMC897]MCZ7414302.1 phage terminase small subunit P27 family [Streptomyces sp. WMMC897]
MGKRGPSKTPTKLALLRGVDKSNPQRINRDEPQPDVGDLEPPAWLDPEALEVWDQYAADLTDKGVLTAWDLETFANLCDAVVRRRRAAAALAAEGEVIDAPVFNKNGDETGTRRGKNPWCLVLDSADAQVRSYATRFGLTPSDRAQLAIKPPESGAGAERLLS